MTDNLYEKVNDNKLSLGCFVYRHPDVGVLLRYNENSGVTQIQALDGVIESPFVISGDHVEVPDGVNSGSITFPFTCSAPTTIAFEAEVIAPDGTSDSFHISVDGGNREAWHLEGTSNDFTWKIRKRLKLYLIRLELEII